MACNLNPQALGEASAVLRQALADGVDLVVINRFGGVEAEGGGFVMELADFIEAGIPVLTAVAARHQSGWQRFTGGLHVALPADEEALMAWCRAQLARRGADGTVPVSAKADVPPQTGGDAGAGEDRVRTPGQHPALA